MQSLMSMNWSEWFLAVGLIVVCMFLMLVILVQRGRGGGLVGAFGGAGGMSAFGAKTGDVFTVITIVFAGVFVVLSVLGNFLYDHSEKKVVASTTPAVTPVSTDPGNGLPAGLPKDAIPLDMPPGIPGQPQTIKVVPGSGNSPVQVVPVNTPPGNTPDPAVTPIQPNQVPQPSGTTSGQPTTTPPTSGEPKPADAGTKPAEAPATPKMGEQPPAEKPKEEPK